MSSLPPIPEDLANSIADSMDTDVELVPFLADLVADLEDLGARSVDVLQLLEDHPPPQGAQVLDLGCGKGSAAIALAERYDVHVLGLDAHPDFVDHANARARERGVAARCRFEVADVALYGAVKPRFDLVLYLAMGDLLGDLEHTLRRLHQHAVPGGLMLLDDAYLEASNRSEPALAEAYAPRETVVADLQRQGDRIVASLAIDGPETRDHYRVVTERLNARAHALAAAYPEVAEAALSFVDEQTSQLAYLDSPVTGALWLLRRTQ